MTRVPLFWDDAIQEHKGAMFLSVMVAPPVSYFANIQGGEQKDTSQKGSKRSHVVAAIELIAKQWSLSLSSM